MTKRKKRSKVRRPRAEVLPPVESEVIVTPLVSDAVVPSILPKGGARLKVVGAREAERRTEEIRSEARAVSGAYLRLGEKVEACLADGVPEALDFTAREWMRHCFAESVAKIYRALRIRRELKALPPAELDALTEGNAYELTRLPEKLRADSEWVVRARTQSNDEFKAAVDAELASRSVAPDEPRATILLRGVPVSLLELFNQAISKAAEVLELDLEGQPGLRMKAFEFIIAQFISLDSELLRQEMQ